ncbi:MAG: 5'-deoxynucleotidase [Christensenellales bacterium]
MSHFFAYLSRMKYILRWNIMRNTSKENIQEHSLQVAMIAHGLAVIGNTLYGKHYDTGKVLSYAVFHEAAEVITGDLATPIKYFNPQIKSAYKEIEKVAEEKLVHMLPGPLQGEYRSLLQPDKDSPEYMLMKAADRICAYLKCVDELKAGNREFEKAKESTRRNLEQYDLDEIRYFMDNFSESFALTLDELN